MIFLASTLLFCVQVHGASDIGERNRLTQVNKSLLKALEVMVGETSVAEPSEDLYFGQITPAKGEGECEAGKGLTESQCRYDVSFGSEWGGSGEYGNWWSGESCGCYLDQNGKRYFNTQTYKPYCESDDNEKLICIVPPPPKKCTSFAFLEVDGQCSFSLQFPSSKCATGYEKINSESECRSVITTQSSNIHWRGSYTPPKSDWPTGCVVHNRPGSSLYQAYWNTRNAECTNCDSEIAPICKLEEQEVGEPWGQHTVSKDCYSFNTNCSGCRGYLDSCCSDQNCDGGRKCKAGVWSYSCA